MKKRFPHPHNNNNNNNGSSSSSSSLYGIASTTTTTTQTIISSTTAAAQDAPPLPPPPKKRISSVEDGGGFPLNTGARIPCVGLGTWQAEGEACKEAVRVALKAGYRHIDCAHLYGNEGQVGEALAEAMDSSNSKKHFSRQDLFITSKVLLGPGGAKRILKAAESSLANLRVDYLDLLLLHWPAPASAARGGRDTTDPPPAAEAYVAYFLQHLPEAWRALELLFHRGVARAIGVSNFDTPLLAQLLSFAHVVPAVNQVELHPLWRQERLLTFCQERGIHVSAHTPLGLPGSTDEGQQELLLSPRFSRSVSVHRPLLKNSGVSQVAQKLNKTPAQVLLRWGIERGTSVLPRSLNPDRIRSNFEILDWSLSPEDWNMVNCMEPQLSLLNDDSAFDRRLLQLSLAPLQSVDETDDDDDDYGPEPS